MARLAKWYIRHNEAWRKRTDFLMPSLLIADEYEQVAAE